MQVVSENFRLLMFIQVGKKPLPYFIVNVSIPRMFYVMYRAKGTLARKWTIYCYSGKRTATPVLPGLSR